MVSNILFLNRNKLTENFAFGLKNRVGWILALDYAIDHGIPILNLPTFMPDLKTS